MLLLLWTLATAEPLEPIVLPVRVHLIDSEVSALDSEGGTAPSEIRARLEGINRAFAPAGIVWQLESVVVDKPDAETAFRNYESEGRKQVLHAVRSAPNRLAPTGFDIYVVQHIGKLDVGGVYQCAAKEPAGHGASFVGSRNKSGRMLPTRKWAHELGHALGLSHTQCVDSKADRLMMSGKCGLAQANRVGFSPREIETMRAQAATGHAAPCKGKKLEPGG